MVSVRRVITASGATAVQIVDYVGGQRVVVAHIGSAHTEAELGILWEKAHDLLKYPGQGELDLGVEVSLPPVAMLAKMSGPGVLALPADVVPAVMSAGRTKSAHSVVLFDLLAGVYSRLGFDVVGDDTFRDMVIARIVQATSIRKMPRVLKNLGRPSVSDKTLRRTLLRCTQRGYRDVIADVCFSHAINTGDVSLCLYDCTTLGFTIEREDDLRKVGYSKTRSIDPQVVMNRLRFFAASMRVGTVRFEQRSGFVRTRWV